MSHLNVYYWLPLGDRIRLVDDTEVKVVGVPPHGSLQALRDYADELEECECERCTKKYVQSGRKKGVSPLP